MSGGGWERHNSSSQEGCLKLHSGTQRKFPLTVGQGHYREAEWCGLKGQEKEAAKSCWGWAVVPFLSHPCPVSKVY